VLINEWAKMTLVLDRPLSLCLFALCKSPISDLYVSIKSLCKSLVHVLMLLVEYDHSIRLLASVVRIITGGTSYFLWLTTYLASRSISCLFVHEIFTEMKDLDIFLNLFFLTFMV